MNELKYEIYKEAALKSIGALCGVAVTMLVEKAVPKAIEAITDMIKARKSEENAIDSDAFEVVEDEGEES